MKTETILKKLRVAQAKIDSIKIKLDEEMNELYFILDDLYYKTEDSPKNKLKKKLK
jgi:hypothetical protein